MKIKPQITVVISICIVLAGIVSTSILGLWATQSTKIPEKLKQEEYSGQYDPSDIRGSYTFSEISNLYSIPIEDLADAFLVDKSMANSFKCKDLEGAFADASNEIGTDSVRLFVAFYHGLPFELSGSTYVTDSAAQILTRRSAILPEQLSYLENHTVIVSR